MTLRTSYNKGFTLIELLVVISIISLLSSIVLASLQSAKNRAQATKVVSEVRQVKQAMEMYRNANGYYYKTLPSDSLVRNATGYGADLNPFVAAMAPYINLSKISFIADPSVNMHYGSESGRITTQYGNAQLATCGGNLIKSDGYIMTFYYPLLSNNEFQKWDYSTNFNCFTND
ncbi:MAG: prepilin-type N-terminal cleavage/methylation domain-containing protein [Patescibacteria group bacterium]